MKDAKTDYSQSLNLPHTDFPMRANLPQNEPGIREKWEKQTIYEKMIEKNKDKKPFVFHDGPPYANGDLHIGHILNKSLKDFIVKYKNMGGFRAPYIHGWDTHGLPIELQMIKKHNLNRNATDPVKFRLLCEQFARDCAQTQKSQIQRLGSLADYDSSYLTLHPEFEAKQIEIFGEMARKGYIYKGKKPVYWCAHDETALAEAEIEYMDDPCDSIYVKFALSKDNGRIKPLIGTDEQVYFVIWTTTTWTLPGNMAICLGPDFTYSFMKYGKEIYLLATELVEAVEREAGLSGGVCLGQIKGVALEGAECAHPFLDRPSYVILGDHVSLDSGTGCVHTAPGHGVDDYNVCLKYEFLKKNIVVPVDDQGRLNELAGMYAGLPVEEANAVIREDLRASGALLAVKPIVHQYPHCWRCKSPILFRATEQWFCSVQGFKKEALEQIGRVSWLPEWGQLRIENMVKDRNDWCISRQRIWGVPIPIFYCAQCGKAIVNEETIRRVADLFGREGSNAWYRYSPREILGESCLCACGCEELKKETDIMDVWFDSGSSYASVLENKYHSFPADLYLEGNDQYRGWFQSSLLTSVATRGVAPYRMVITHGMVVDGEGKKMSKSLGNGIDPLDVIREYGADILRLWVSSVDYTNDVRISGDIVKQLSDIYRKIRNTIRILLGNIGTRENDFDPEKHTVPQKELLEIDKWALSRLNGLVGRVRQAYDAYTFHAIYHDIHNFCVNDMSKLYIDITKDRMYVQRKNDRQRRSAQTVMYRILHSLIRLIAPLLSYTAEEAWSYMAHTKEDDVRSVFLNDMPEYRADDDAPETEERYNKLFAYRDDVMKALEEARARKEIGKSLDAALVLYGTKENEAMRCFASFREILPAVFIVSKVELSFEAPPEHAFSQTEYGIQIAVNKAPGIKCPRCWMYTEETGGEAELCPRCKKAMGE